jgi:MFS family permease
MRLTIPGDSEFRCGWRPVLACFGMAIFAWGFGFYGQTVYLAALHAKRGWSAGLISGGSTVFYLWGAVLLALVPGAMERFGARTVSVSGALLLGLGTSALSVAATPWQLYASMLVMGAGWACTSTAAIAVILAGWFDRRRGLAISLALNGASMGGLVVAPLLVSLVHALGLSRAVPYLVCGALLVLLPLLLVCLKGNRPDRETDAPAAEVERDAKPTLDSRGAVLCHLGFWSIALPFALALMAQVGFIVHQMSILLLQLGLTSAGSAVAMTAGAATVGRLSLATVIDRVNQRLVAALSFASQAGGLGLILACPHAHWALYLGSVVFGLSVGNVVTLPALIVQREFATRSFGLVIGLSSMIGQIGLSAGPGLLGLLRDLSGGYAVSIGLCVGVQIVAALSILLRPSSAQLPATRRKRLNAARVTSET